MQIGELHSQQAFTGKFSGFNWHELLYVFEATLSVYIKSWNETDTLEKCLKPSEKRRMRDKEFDSLKVMGKINA